MEMFEQASRLKLRVNIAKGDVTVEDLWDLPLTSVRGYSLDKIAKGLNAELKEQDVESFVEVKSTKNEALNLMFDIVKHIIKVKLAENAEKLEAKKNNDKQATIRSIIHAKKHAELADKSIADLEAMLSE